MCDFLEGESKAVLQLIAQFFNAATWRELVDPIKRRYLQMTRNYVDIPEDWEDNPMPKPDFMIKRKENVDVPKQLTNAKSIMDVPLRKYPKRNVPEKNYLEEEGPADDRYVFCDNCEEDYIDYCSKCGMLVILKDNPVPMGVEMRARKTVPKGVLEVRPSNIHGLGIFASKPVQKGVRMGPYEGEATKVDTSKGYAWKLRGGYLIDGSDEKCSNYLRYVNCARNVSEQNLVAFQYKGELYYRTSRDILPGEELLVFYGSSFAKNLGINTKSYFEPVEEKEEFTCFSCKYCHIGLSSGDYRDKHELKCKFNPIRMRQCNEFFTCKFCKCDLTSKEYLEHHEKYCSQRTDRKKKLEDGKEYMCTYCEYASEYKSVLKTHILRKHEKENNEIFYCNICKYKSYMKSDLKQHFKTHEISKFVCIACNINFISKGNLYNHYLWKHPEKSNNVTCKIHQCEYCTYKTVFKTHLQRHKCKKKLENQIDNRKQYFCTKCNYSTDDKGNLKRHQRIHDDKKKPFKCGNCDKFFNVKHSLDGHILTKHKNDSTLIKSITSKIHKCQICFHQTVHMTNLKRHLKTHLKTNS